MYVCHYQQFTNNLHFIHNLFQVEIIAGVSFLSLDSDVTSHSLTFCFGGYILMNQRMGWGGIAFMDKSIRNGMSLLLASVQPLSIGRRYIFMPIHS